MKPQFVCWADDPQWKAERSKVLSGSRVAAAMGLSPFTSREQLLASYREPEKPFKISRPMWWGMEMEHANGLALALSLGGYFESCPKFYSDGVLGATTDGYIYDLGVEDLPEVSVTSAPTYWKKFTDDLATIADLKVWVELKNCGLHRKTEWAKEVPQYYWVQCQVQMAMLEVDAMVCCAKIGAADMRAHVVRYDSFFIEEAREVAATFMEEVKNGNV